MVWYVMPHTMRSLIRLSVRSVNSMVLALVHRSVTYSLAVQDFMTVYGLKEIATETDHKPLESILKKPLHQADAGILW